MSVAPTLLVGLGGTGSDILNRVSALLNEGQKQKVSICVLDTDVNELSDIKNRNPKIQTIQTSANSTVGEYLSLDRSALDEWFPVNQILNRKTLTEGAGQVRAISRLAFDAVLRNDGMEPLHKAVDELFKLESSGKQQALRVVIVSSLAGGTGSGIILPTAMYIKKYLKSRFPQLSSITRGFFILPEVFFDVIKGKAERDNLRVNAYATLRELDAFLMKGDGSLASKYEESVRLKFPKSNSNDYEEVNEMPYDYCFLFDSINIDGKTMSSFNQYKEHAANCIYAQSIGPMNKRSNSSEDNTIREIAKQGGRNRYAAAGSAVLKYPWEDVRDFIALKWAQENISSQWLRFDHEIMEKRKANAELRSKGHYIKDMDRGKAYIDSVESQKASGIHFAGFVSGQMDKRDDQGEKIGTKDQDYLMALQQFVSRHTADDISGTDKLRMELENLSSESEGSDYADMFERLEQNYKKMKIRAEESGKSKAYSLFNSDHNGLLVERQPQHFETYLRTTDGKFMHPNSIRYMIYKTKELLDGKCQQLQTEIDSLTQTLDRQRTALFQDFVDVRRSGDLDASPDLLRSDTFKHKGFFGRKNRQKLEELKESYRQKYLYWTDDLAQKLVMLPVILEAIDYLDKIASSFENFFTRFENDVQKLDYQSYDIKTRYNNVKGAATHYVCANQKCIEKIYEDTPYMGSHFELDTELVTEIYGQVREYALLNEKERNEDFFDRLFDRGILGYFKKQVMQQHGSKVKMDIIDALKKEVELTENERSQDQQFLYAKTIIDGAKELAKPFLELPRFESTQPIVACTYNIALEKSNDPQRTAFINQELNDYGAVPTESEVDEHTILFYQALYSIKASSLSKFAPAVKTTTSEHQDGAYSRAYWELVHQLKPGKGNKPIITPHIHREWHLMNRMPDIDETAQAKAQTRLYKAVFRGLMEKKIEFIPLNDGMNIYRYSGSRPVELKVSNNTPCDHFYEVFDAFQLNQDLISNTMDAVEDDFSRAKFADKDFAFKQTPLFKGIAAFRLSELDVVYKAQPYLYQENGAVVNSIFDIPMFYRVSGRNLVEPEEGIEILNAILEETYRVVEESEPAEYVDQVYAEFLSGQFWIFEQNIQKYYLDHLQEPWVDSYLDTVLHTIVEKLKEVQGSVAETMRKHVHAQLTDLKHTALERRK
ncbi:MAG: tubulin-like doman-containing protein [Turicibacter sp.]|nr:tubulin-like doman-containing protein [Turicibacter sp.]